MLHFYLPHFPSCNTVDVILPGVGFMFFPPMFEATLMYGLFTKLVSVDPDIQNHFVN